MSDNECHFGRLIPIEQKETLEATAKFHLEALGVTDRDFDDFTTSWLDYMKHNMGAFDNKFAHIHNGKIYRIENEQLDEYGFSRSQEKEDGTIEYQLLFYNGGGSFDEVLDSALARVST